MSEFFGGVSSDIIGNSDFRNDFGVLTISELAPELRHPLSQSQVGRLIESAAVLSLSNDENHKKIAYKIAIYLLNQYKSEYGSIPFIAELVLTRLGDLPVIQHMTAVGDTQDYFGYFPKKLEGKLFGQNGSEHALSIRFPEALEKKTVNQFHLAQSMRVTFTDFQAQSLVLLQEQIDVAFSAPTSAGKSYVILNYLADLFSKSEALSIVYIVPTKALVAEVQRNFLETFKKLGVKRDFLVFTGASILNRDEVLETSKKVFVLTQERLQEILANDDVSLHVDVLVVDEAQQIANEGRGIIHEDAILDLVRHNPRMQKIFISPYVSNLDKYAKIFDIAPERFRTKTTRLSPVAQSILFINFQRTGARGKYGVDISLLSQELGEKGSSRMPLTSLELNKLPTSIYAKKAWVAGNLIGGSEPTLIYCNTRVECRRVCEKLVSATERRAVADPELKEAISFLREHVHPDYYLAEYLGSRIGFHYGTMPQFVRSYVKQLFETKKIVHLACTSTLLEGVNLPAKNLVVYSPYKGPRRMDKLSFRNLVGRAGRLQMDYYGKIYCINVKEWDPKEEMFDDKLETIESSTITTLSKHAKDLIEFLSNSALKPKDVVASMATSLLMKQIMDPHRDFLSRFQKLHEGITQEVIEKIRSLLIDTVDRLSISKREVYTRNRSIDPRFQDELYLALKNQGIRVLPPFPGQPDFYDSLKKIFQLISQYLFREKNNQYVFYTFIANLWINETPYKKILDRQISRRIHSGVEDHVRKNIINKSIDDLNTALEEKLRYDYTRGLKCYTDIIQFLLAEENSKLPYCEKLHQYLESGASSNRVLFLTGAGLTRATAIQITEALQGEVPEWTTIRDTIKWLKDNLDVLRGLLHPILFQEIEQLVL